MKAKFIKNFYNLLLAILIFVIVEVVFFIVIFQPLPIEVIITFAIIQAVMLLALFLMRRHLFSMIQITQTDIEIRFFSKTLQSFKIDEFEEVKFVLGNNRNAEIEFYMKGKDNPILIFHMTKGRLRILKKVENFSPNVREKIQNARANIFGWVKTYHGDEGNDN